LQDRGLGGHLYAISECSAAGLLCAFLESSVGCLTALLIFGEQCWLGSLRAAGFQQAREVGVSALCEVSIGKGGSLMVVEAKRIALGSWTRLGCSGK